MGQFSGLMQIVTKSKFFIVALLVLLIGACQPEGAATSEENQAFSAVRNNNDVPLSQYLAEGGDPNAMNKDGDALLYVASGARGGIEVANLLILGGADLNQISREGRTALHTAAAWCNSDIVALLLGAGARVDILNFENLLAIDVVCARPQQRREQVLALFFKSQSDS